MAKTKKPKLADFKLFVSDDGNIQIKKTKGDAPLETAGWYPEFKIFYFTGLSARSTARGFKAGILAAAVFRDDLCCAWDTRDEAKLTFVVVFDRTNAGTTRAAKHVINEIKT